MIKTVQFLSRTNVAGHETSSAAGWLCWSRISPIALCTRLGMANFKLFNPSWWPDCQVFDAKSQCTDFSKINDNLASYCHAWHHLFETLRRAKLPQKLQGYQCQVCQVPSSVHGYKLLLAVGTIKKVKSTSQDMEVQLVMKVQLDISSKPESLRAKCFLPIFP